MILVIGLMGDSIGVWESSPFLTNLLSSLTGFCFAVPVAIIVLHRVSTYQMDHQQWRTLSGLASDLSHRMSALAMGLRVNSTLSDHEAASDAFWAAHSETVVAIKDWLDALNVSDQRLTSGLEQVITQGDRCIRAWNACWKSPLDVGGSLVEIRMRWNTLIGDVEPRLREIGRPLFPTPELHLQMEEALEWVGAGSPSGLFDSSVSPLTWIDEARSVLARIREKRSSPFSSSGPLVEGIRQLEQALSSSAEEHDRYEYLAEVTSRLRSVVDAAVTDPQRLSS
ncbi:hypothetical protein [Microbispora bryophytorum]|nr:hypothetical protein [Microbispora bryophytorum]MBD3135111.1 hypothetical protein [Microbispora bryophytorum]TQS08662.1 hypothetical protein FLX07_05250 [Microbispora bryophytorum]